MVESGQDTSGDFKDEYKGTYAEQWGLLFLKRKTENEILKNLMSYTEIRVIKEVLQK